MLKAAPYELVFASQVHDHLQAIEPRFYSLIRETLEDQLRYEPLTETRNRKKLRRETEFGATCELRFGPSNRFRVFYGVAEDVRQVRIVAIGIKQGNRLFIGKEVYEL